MKRYRLDMVAVSAAAHAADENIFPQGSGQPTDWQSVGCAALAALRAGFTIAYRFTLQVNRPDKIYPAAEPVLDTSVKPQHYAQSLRDWAKALEAAAALFDQKQSLKPNQSDQIFRDLRKTFFRAHPAFIALATLALGVDEKHATAEFFSDNLKPGRTHHPRG